LGLIEGPDSPRLSPVVHRLLSLPRFEPRRVSDLLLGEPAPASLAWKAFEHLGDLRDLAARIVAGAGSLRGTTRRGVNLLFYGPPGTGKTEFAKTLGARVGFSVQFCGETGEESAEPNRRDRIAALLIILDNLGSHKGKAVRRTIRNVGARLVFLPKYSPDLNPIEQVFAKFKTLLRKAGARSYEAISDACREILAQYPPAECAAYLKNAGYA
jgi:transposase